jgi:hypothetical protein
MDLFKISSAEMERKLKQYEGMKGHLLNRADRNRTI